MIIESPEGMENTILPETSLVMALRLKGKVEYFNDSSKNILPAAVITGIRKKVRQLSYIQDTATLLVKFNEGMAASFFNEPLHELAGQSYSLDTLIKRSLISAIEEQLSEAKSHKEYILLVENFLILQLKQNQADLLVSSAISQIQQAKGIISIDQMMKSIPLSRDAFEKRFRKAVGTSPKQFSTIIKLNQVISSYNGQTSLTKTAYSAGYYDQSHFIKDFRSYTGESPSNFFRAKDWW